MSSTLEPPARMRRLSLVLLAAIPSALLAADLTLTQFTNGTVANATEVNANFTALKTAVETLQNAAPQVPSGAVLHFASTTCPTGWVKANGATVSATTYPALATALGTSGNFALPDLRGEFVRGLDDGRGVDPGRTIRTFQDDMFENHTHVLPLGGDGFVVGHMPQRTGNNNDTGTTSTSPTGGTETRPRNIALLACIKT